MGLILLLTDEWFADSMLYVIYYKLAIGNVSIRGNKKITMILEIMFKNIKLKGLDINIDSQL